MEIKTKINLKVTKLYHDHVERTKSEERKALEPVIEIKDKFGRVMEKVNPLMQSKKVPSKSRPPKKRPPLVKKKSFVEDQKIYNDAERLYNPLA